MHEFTEKFGMTFANFLDLGPHSQPKRKLIDISGERGIIFCTCTKKAYMDSSIGDVHYKAMYKIYMHTDDKTAG